MVGIGVGPGAWKGGGGGGGGGGGVTPQNSVRVDIRSGKSYFMFCITDVMWGIGYPNWILVRTSMPYPIRGDI